PPSTTARLALPARYVFPAKRSIAYQLPWCDDFIVVQSSPSPCRTMPLYPAIQTPSSGVQRTELRMTSKGHLRCFHVDPSYVKISPCQPTAVMCEGSVPSMSLKPRAVSSVLMSSAMEDQ